MWIRLLLLVGMIAYALPSHAEDIEACINSSSGTIKIVTESAAVCPTGSIRTSLITAESPPPTNAAVGSWFGRAVPDQTICAPGTPGCPIPAEIVLLFTLNADGTFVGTDSGIFTGGDRATAHGQWGPDGDSKIKAEFTLLQSSPTGVFIGGLKNLLTATVETDAMSGVIDEYLYLYTDPNGAAIVDADGFPTPSPLASPSACVSTVGCVSFGTFTLKARRVTTH